MLRSRFRKSLTPRKRGVSTASRRLTAAWDFEQLEAREMLAKTVLSANFEPPSYSGFPDSVRLENTSGGPINAPGSYALKLIADRNGYGEFVFFPANLSGYDSGYVTFAVEPGGNADPPESNDTLGIDYKKSGNPFFSPNSGYGERIGELFPANYPSNSFTTVRIDLPQAALHRDFVLEIDYTSSDWGGLGAFTDNWFIDNVRIIANHNPKVSSLSGPTGTRTDADLPLSYSWTTSDADNDNLTVQSVLTRNNTTIATSSSANGSLQITSADLLGTFPQTFKISVTANDGTHQTSPATRSVTITDDDTEAPTVTLGGSVGDELAVDTQEFTWSVDDPSGSTTTVTVTRNGSPIFTRSYTENVALDSFNFDSYGVGEYVLTVDAADNDADRENDSTAAATAVRQVNVLNTNPVADLAVITAASARFEGVPVLFSAAGSTDPDGDDEALTFVWDFGTGELLRGEEVGYAFPDDGTYGVRLLAIDSYGGIAEATTTVVVANVAPTVSLAYDNGPIEAAEFVVDLSIVDPGEDSALGILDWGDGNQQIISESGAYSHTYQTGGSQSAIAVSLIDEDGNHGQVFSQAVDIANAPPVIMELPALFTVASGNAVQLGATVVDGASDTLTYAWLYGNGASDSGVSLATTSYTYPADGLYDVMLSVTDSDGLTSSATTRVAVGVPVSFSQASLQVDEDAGDIVVTVVRDNGLPFDQTFTIPLRISGTVNESDYVATDIVIEPGQATGTATISIVDDHLSEALETMIVSIGGVAGVAAGAVPQQTITIADNDELPEVYFSTLGGFFDESAGAVLLQGSLSVAAGRDVIVPLSFSGGATFGDDFDVENTSIMIQAGQTTGHVLLQIVDDKLTEAAETAVVSMEAPTGAVLSTTIGRSTTAAVTILQNDAPVVELDSAYRITSEAVAELYLNARLSLLSAETISVPYSVSGTATSGVDYHLLDGELIFLPGSLETTLRVNVVDDLIDEEVENFVVELGTPSGNAVIGVSSTVVTDILDNDVSRVSFDQLRHTVFEGDPSLTLPVTLSLPVSTTVTVPITLKGLAEDGRDFTISATELTFAPGELSQDLVLTFPDDLANRPTVELFLSVEDVEGVALGDIPQTQVTIQDDDPFITLEQVAYTALESDEKFQVTARLSAPTNKAVTIPLQYRGTAGRDADYQTPLSIIIPAGATKASIDVELIDDDLYEGDETIRIYPQTPTSGQLRGKSVLETTIRDNDEPQRLFWTVQRVTTREGVNLVTMQVELTRAVSQMVRVDLEFRNGTAVYGADYIPTVSSLKFAPGETKRQFDIIINDDTTSEDIERFEVRLKNPVGAQLAVNPLYHFASVSIADNEVLSVAESAQIQSSIDNHVNSLGSPTNDLVGLGRVFLEVAQVVGNIALSAKALGNSLDFLANYIPPPFNFAADIPIKAVKFLIDHYPCGVGQDTTCIAFDAHAVVGDYEQDEWRFLRRMVSSIAKDMMLDYLGPLYKFNFFQDIGVGLTSIVDWIGENVNLDLQTFHIEIPAFGFNTRDITAEGTLNAIDTWDDAAKEWWDKQVASINTSSLGSASDIYNGAARAVSSWFGPAAGRTIFVDMNFNGVLDEGEPTAETADDGRTLILGMDVTDVNGNGAFDIDEGQWVSMGGIDTSVNRPIDFNSRAPANYETITPTSTFIAELLSQGVFARDAAGVELAERRVLEAFGAHNVTTADFDFVQQAANGDEEAALLFTRETQLYNVVSGL
ncbi:MAG: PKD domain-containing protein, partial [Planctomycetales bacterium]|nr:PKD domain-containing protein [Planctomycetales bacterium]